MKKRKRYGAVHFNASVLKEALVKFESFFDDKLKMNISCDRTIEYGNESWGYDTSEDFFIAYNQGYETADYTCSFGGYYFSFHDYTSNISISVIAKNISEIEGIFEIFDKASMVSSIKDSDCQQAGITKITKNREFRVAFTASESNISSVDSLLRAYATGVTYAVDLVDNSTLDCRGLDEIFKLVNTKEKMISSIILSTNYSSPMVITVKFGGVFCSIQYTIKGGEKETYYLSDKLDDEIKKITQWYTPIATLNIIGLLAMLLSIYIVMSILHPAIMLCVKSSLNVTRISESTLAFYAHLAIIYGVSFILNLARKWLFPLKEFLIGAGINRHASISFWRTIILVGFIVSFLASITANYFTTKKVALNVESTPIINETK